MYLALVGDLSNGDTARLDKVLTAALTGGSLPQGTIPPADIVVQLGDLSGGYDVIRKHLATNKLRVVPGNHDLQYDSLGIPRNWRADYSPVTLVGIDNSEDIIDQEGWAVLTAEETQPFTFVFMHKPPVPIVLPDLTESTHMMGEGNTPNPDRDRLVKLLRTNTDVVACGHYHGWTQQQTPFGQMIVEGRGGAAAELAYTLVGITLDGWVLHSVPVS